MFNNRKFLVQENNFHLFKEVTEINAITEAVITSNTFNHLFKDICPNFLGCLDFMT
jgi:hypothetical protein